VSDIAFIPPLLRARVLRVIDGDTIDVEIDCGFRTVRTERLRLLGVNAPELRAREPAEREAAQLAKAHLMQRLPATPGRWSVLIRTSKADAFGRYLADIWAGPSDIPAHHVNAELLSLGLASVYARK